MLSLPGVWAPEADHPARKVAAAHGTGASLALLFQERFAQVPYGGQIFILHGCR